MNTDASLFEEHEEGKHIEENVLNCWLCKSRSMDNPSDRDIMELITFVKDMLYGEAHKSRNTQFSFQLISNLDVSLREKIFDEAIYGRKV